MIICILCTYAFDGNHFARTFQERTICISYWLGLPRILLICLCLFLDHNYVSQYYWHGGNFKAAHLFILYFKVFLLTYILLLKCHYLFSLTYQWEGIFSFHNHGIYSVACYISISLDSKVPEKKMVFWFWLLFILLIWKFLTPASADGFSMEFEFDQVS